MVISVKRYLFLVMLALFIPACSTASGVKRSDPDVEMLRLQERERERQRRELEDIRRQQFHDERLRQYRFE